MRQICIVAADMLSRNFLQSGRGDPSPTMRSEARFPFDGKCSYFVRMRRLSADKRMQTGEIWAFNVKEML